MLLLNATAYRNGAFHNNTCIRTYNGLICEIGPRLCPAPGEQVYDLAGAMLLPGFVDVHIHACMGYDTMRGEADLRAMSRALLNMGVAAFLPTTMSASAEATVAALRSVRRVMDRPQARGAFVCGAHMEAPFLNAEKCGAQKKEYFVLPEEETFLRLCEGDPTRVRILTLAPQLPGAMQLIPRLTALGIRVSAGHTQADAETLHRAAGLGLSRSTHTLNAQPPMLSRAPGAAGAALSEKGLYCELIADGIHLHRDMVRLIALCKGRTHAVAVTDAMEAAGLPQGEYSLGGQKVYVRDHAARLADGTLAGSVLTMKDAFLNLMHMGIQPQDAAAMCTLAPADSAGLTTFGRIEEGCHAIFTVWNEHFTTMRVLCDPEPQ